ncbi:MAG: metal-dependent transcriptional regulator [Lachnospiraceae bacterium]|nr:metal-dependent transcriptional regulator [Lachnospiraceae bacterium]
MNYVKHKAEESLEDYLETILSLQNKLGQVRSIDIVHELGYSKPSVSVAMKNLREREYITMTSDGYITLTESGKQRAENVMERHKLLYDWLIRIGVSEKTAMEDACKIEHDLSEETFLAIKKFLTE